MRVIQLTQRFPPAVGGVEQHVYHLSEGLARAGVSVEVVTTDMMRVSPFARIERSTESFPFPVFRVRAWKLFQEPYGMAIIAPSMIWETLESDVDIVHAHAYGQFPTLAGTIASWLDDSAFVITPHSDAGRSSWGRAVFDRVVPSLTLRPAARVIAVSRHEAVHLASLGVQSAKISVIPNGIDLTEFSGMSGPSGTDSTIVGLFVGRLDTRQKGLATLIRAISLLPSSSDFQIRLVGEDWGGVQALTSLAHELGVDGRVKIVGKLDRSALLREYQNADFLVLPSVFEPFGIVLLEAMASGLPVVASRVGGIPEIVEEGQTGLMVAPNDSRALAEAIGELSQNDRLRRSMGRKGRERASYYSWELIVPKILAVYEQALEGRGG